MNLLLIGCGNLGAILLEIWSSTKLFNQIIVVQPSLSRADDFKQNPKIQFLRSAKEIPLNYRPDIVVLAVKPQIIHDIISDFSEMIRESLIISLMAGIKIDRLIPYLNKQAKIIRLMPNVAMKVGESANLAFANEAVLPQDLSLADKIFSDSGKMLWLKQEEFIDILTPISGSGPAYFFLMAEILTQATIKWGLDEKMARDLVRQTFLGSALLAAEGGNFEALASSVAGKGGVTEAVLKVLNPDFQDLMNKALDAGLKRVNELA